LCYVNDAGFICASHIRYQRHQPRCERKQFAPPEYEMKLEGKRILLVEDEYFIVQDLARAFSAAGATVLGPAATLSEALELVVSSGALDGAVLDINLQGEMVFPLADVLVNRGVPFVFATGYGQEAIPPVLRILSAAKSP